MDVKYETDRLFLRTWKKSDLETFYKINSDPQVMEFMPKTLRREESNQAAERIQAHFKSHNFGLWAIELKSTHQFIGFVGLSIPTFESHFTPCVEIAWRLGKDFWGKGFATEAAKKSLEIGFTTFNLNEILAFTVLANLRSIGIMKKLGMKTNPLENFDHPKLPENSPLKKHVLYRINKLEWQKSSTKPKVTK